MEDYVGTAAAAQDERTRADQAQMAQDDELDRLAQTIKAAATTGGSTARTGIVMVDPLDGWTQIDLGGGELVQAKVSGSFRSTVKAGQEVRIAAQGGGVWYIGEILTPLEAPAVAAAPSAASNVSGTGATVGNSLGGYPPVTNPPSIGSYYDAEAAFEIVWNYLNALLNQVNDIVSAYNETASAVGGIVTGVNSVVTKVNAVSTTAGALRSALIDQGHIT